MVVSKWSFRWYRPLAKTSGVVILANIPIRTGYELVRSYL